jgi:hypothetical protein
VGAAPLLWLAQMLISYALSADVCVGLPSATAVFSAATLRNTLFAGDAIAGLGAIAGGLLSYRTWHLAGRASAGETLSDAVARRDRTRFLAEWGLWSSLWFFGAIVFNTIASIMVAPCLR